MKLKAYLFILLFLIGNLKSLSYSNELQSCHKLIKSFLTVENFSIKYWPKNQNIYLKNYLIENNFKLKEIEKVFQEISKNNLTFDWIKNYLLYTKTFKTSNEKKALKELLILEENQTYFYKKFLKHEKKISEKKLNPIKLKRYRDLYYSCRSFIPNPINKIATNNYQKFSFGLSLGTLTASYAFYNMDKEINAEWFERLAYDLANSMFFSYVSGKIQGNVADTQLLKSLKNYFLGRVVGVSDLLIYDPLFNEEEKKAKERLDRLKQHSINQYEINTLYDEYEKRGIYRKYKNYLIMNLKKANFDLNLGHELINLDGVDFTHLKKEDLENENVQNVLLFASMASIYNQNKGEWLDTGDFGLDRYLFNTLYYGAQIPKSMAQNFITYQMLCMGQDNPTLSFTKALIFNITINFFMNQGMYFFREKSIGN